MRHFGVVVVDVEVEASTEKVESCGVEKGLREDNGVRESFAHVRDSDGYVIEITSQQIVFSMDFRR